MFVCFSGRQDAEAFEYSNEFHGENIKHVLLKGPTGCDCLKGMQISGIILSCHVCILLDAHEIYGFLLTKPAENRRKCIPPRDRDTPMRTRAGKTAALISPQRTQSQSRGGRPECGRAF
jgi:hypothetical protein